MVKPSKRPKGNDKEDIEAGGGSPGERGRGVGSSGLEESARGGSSKEEGKAGGEHG